MPVKAVKDKRERDANGSVKVGKDKQRGDSGWGIQD